MNMNITIFIANRQTVESRVVTNA